MTDPPIFTTTPGAARVVRLLTRRPLPTDPKALTAALTRPRRPQTRGGKR